MSVLTVGQLEKLLEERIPAALREPWDHDGRMVLPDASAPVTGVLCALDCTSDVIRYAKERGCNVIVTHHPLLFDPLQAVHAEDSVGKRVLACVQAGISVFSFHTRLDCMEGGVNDCLARLLELQNCRAFVPFGRIGEVPAQLRTFSAFSAFVAEKVGVVPSPCVHAQDTVHRVAIIAGCGKDEIGEVIASGADTFVTGEVMHNHLIDCRELGLNLLCVTHEASERVVLPFLSELVAAACSSIGCGVQAEIYPFFHTI